jgi:hypothetical protein
VDNYLPPLRSSRRRTHAPSDVQRNRGRKGQKKRKAACQEKNHGRGNQAGIARSVPHRGRVLQGVKRSPCSVLPERPFTPPPRKTSRCAYGPRAANDQRQRPPNAPSPPGISTVDFESSDSTAIQAAAHRSSAAHSPSRSDVFPLLASEKSPFWTLFACTEDRQGATVTACEPAPNPPFLRFHPGGPTFRPASRDAVFP